MDKVKIVFIVNGDTIDLQNNSLIRFYDTHDTINVPVISQQFQLDRSINLKLTKLVLVVKNEVFSITTVGDDTFESVFEKDMPPGTLTIQYYNRYELAKRNYGEYITISEENFKSVTVWNYDWYFRDTFIFEEK